MRNILLHLILLLVVACSASPRVVPFEGSDRFTILSLGKADLTDVMAVSRLGRYLAWSGREVSLIDTQSIARRQLLPVRADGLCWSPDGRLLAAATQVDGEAHLSVFDSAGRLVYETPLPGRASRLQWPESGVLSAGLLEVKTFSFGTHVEGQLLSWDENWRVSKQVLFEKTLVPVTVRRLGDRLFRTFDFDLSPLGDEILYARILAPPAFAASRELVVRNHQTGMEKVVAALPLEKGLGRLGADGETVLVDDGLGQVRLQDTWSGKTLQAWDGSLVAYEPSTDLLLTDRAVYQGEQLLVTLPDKGRVAFSGDGSSLAVAWNKSLFLLKDFPIQQRPRLPDADLKKLQRLRRLRSNGLIEDSEYRQARERVVR